jgi:hypothetical protein
MNLSMAMTQDSEPYIVNETLEIRLEGPEKWLPIVGTMVVWAKGDCPRPVFKAMDGEKEVYIPIQTEDGEPKYFLKGS